MGCTNVQLPRFQRQLVDWLDLNVRHPSYSLFEVDVTQTRQAIREYRRRTGRPLSLTAFVTACFAQAVEENRLMHACRHGRRRLTIFDDVDVAFAVEHEIEGHKIPMPSIIRSANRMAPYEIEREIRDAKTGTNPRAWAMSWLGPWLLLPGAVRRFILRRLLANPVRRRRITGTVMVSAAGMFGMGTGWGVSPPSYTSSLLIGSLGRKAMPVDGRTDIRQVLNLTVCVDHDVIDGAVAARFSQRLKELIECSSGLASAALLSIESDPVTVMVPAE